MTAQASLESFADLLRMARAEPDPARLLTVLVKAQLAYRRRDDSTHAMLDEGLLEPVMARDWAITEDLSLDQIVTTADEVVDDWRFIMTAVFPGSRGTAPTSAACDPHLERMAKALMLNESLDSFVFFDRHGTPVQIQGAAGRP